MSPLLDTDALAALEAQVHEALRTGDTSALRVLGYGEITLVLGTPADAPTVAAKRLPVFHDAAHADRYGALVLEYVAELATRGLHVQPTEWVSIPTADGGCAGYVLQPVLPAATLAPGIVAAAPPTGGDTMARVVDAIVATTDERCGLDGQLSNWAVLDGELRYLDVTTPLLRDGEQTRLDLDLLVSPLPALARSAVRRFVAPGIVGAYHVRRDVLRDLVGNLLKERLDAAIEPTLALANAHVDEPITREEVERWYRSDARTWAALLSLRRADRWWQRHVRRRTYPFLLPGAIAR